MTHLPCRSILFAVAIGAPFAVTRGADPLPHHVWIEAEMLGPLQGSNFSFLPLESQKVGAWGLSGPGVADAWTQGGESEFLSVAARADAAAGVMIGREIEIPAAGNYTLWVRYSDYREKEEAVGVRVVQGGKTTEHIFGKRAVVDELDPMKLLWEWSFAWDKAAVPLSAGIARVELFTPGPSGARRQVDALCFTTDEKYRPHGRNKPDDAAWATLRKARDASMPRVEPLATPAADVPPAWKIAKKAPVFLWNVGKPWGEELKKPLAERVDHPFGVDEPLMKEFLTAHAGKVPQIYGDPASGPVWHIPEYPNAFAAGSLALDWLARHPERSFALLLNYANPAWPKDADKPAVRANLLKLGDRFEGYISGESISHTDYDTAALNTKVQAAKSRADVLAALRDVHTASVVKKFGDYYGAAVTPAEAWAPVISCLSANMEAFSHALGNWGVRKIGHENTANSPTLARRLAFLRGAARQFGCGIADYQSANFGDAATMYSRQAFFYPASSRYVLDNSYYAFAGAGMNWLWKDYALWHLAGVSAFYNEQGIDMFWKPGGNSAGDNAPVQLSPKGKVAETMVRLAREHPRGTQWTPVAFLLDEAHGYSQERFTPGSFGLDPTLNPAVLAPGRHEAALRAWFDIAYFPAPETQNENAAAGRQGFVNGIFGDIFDVIVNTAGKAAILKTYPVVIAAGELVLSAEWGKALAEYVEGGGTLVVCADALTGEGVNTLKLPKLDAPLQTASAFIWELGGESVAAQTFRFHPLPKDAGRVLASAAEGAPIATVLPRGKGRLVTVGIPLGLGIDERPAALLAPLMRHLTDGLAPVRAVGDIEWVLNRLDDGNWLIALLNNAGMEKPQHGIVPTRHEELREVKLETAFPIASSEEWLTKQPVAWKAADKGATAQITVPAGAVRFIAVKPGK